MEYFSAKQIARHLGVLTQDKKPHYKVIHYIISQLSLIPQDTVERFIYVKKGERFIKIKYQVFSEDIENLVAEWLDRNKYPNNIKIDANYVYHIIYQHDLDKQISMFDLKLII